jgi:hypothetical protein
MKGDNMQTGILTEDNGNPSTMRLISITLVIAAICFGAFAGYTDKPTDSASFVAFQYLLLAGVGGKGGQKLIEVVASQLLANKGIAPTK